MASQPNQLPLLYTELEALSAATHGNYKLKTADLAPYLTKVHAVPITVDEFISVQRYYPIVFSVGDNPVPLALMGLNEGVNTYVDDDGKLLRDVYVPAYVRRFPFMLARLRPNSEELSLCFDPSSGLVGDFEEGEPLFTDGKPSQGTNRILKFAEEFELSAQRTNAFVKDLKESGLLIDGEVSIQPEGADKPFIYRGFQMVEEKKLREARGDELRKLNQNNVLPFVMAHLFSMPLIRQLFIRQVSQGKGPVAAPAQSPSPVQA